MKQCRVQLIDVNGDIIEETEIKIYDGDTLIMQYPENLTMESASDCFKQLQRGLESGAMIGLPDCITFKVIKIL
ncbi:hypothetical protein [Halalkalibacter oceani]|uniref:hypothetical protein n=1 Tax=Halalkalibacter oceani TaxID=1653776 RepID=UPI0033941432